MTPLPPAPPAEQAPHKEWFYKLNRPQGPIKANCKTVRILSASRYLDVAQLLAHAGNTNPGGTRSKLFPHFTVAHSPEEDVVTLIGDLAKFRLDPFMEHLYLLRRT